MTIERGFLVRQPWVDKILGGQKRWEIRGSPTRQRGWVGLIESGTGQVVGAVRIDDCRGPLDPKNFRDHADKHQVQLGPDENLPYDPPYAWVIGEAVRLEEPVPYEHPQGAVIWVRLSPEVGQAVADQLAQRQGPQGRSNR